MKASRLCGGLWRSVPVATGRLSCSGLQTAVARLASCSTRTHCGSLLPRVSSSPLLRCFHHPRAVRGVGPRPDSPQRRVVEERRRRQREQRRAQLAGRIPIHSRVRAEEPPLLSLPPTQPSQPRSPFTPAAVSLLVPVMSLRSGAGTARSLQLPASLFSACAVRVDLLHRVVEWQRARQRSGTATTLSRGQVSGTGRKPHPQKGSGRARQGTKRAPHHRGGGHAHAKKQREFAFKLNKKIRARGLAAALSTRLAQGRCTVIADTALGSHKTRLLLSSLRRLGLSEGLIIHGQHESDANLSLAARNVRHVDLLPACGANVLSILRHPSLLLTEAAVHELQQRVARTLNPRRSRVRFMVGRDGGGLTADEFARSIQITSGEQEDEAEAAAARDDGSEEAAEDDAAEAAGARAERQTAQ